MLSPKLLLTKSLLLCVSLLLAACAGAPEKPQSTIAVNATEANINGLALYAQGEFEAAADAFSLALRLRESLDDAEGAALNRINLARTQLSLGQAANALETIAPLLASAKPQQRASEAAAIRVQALQQLGLWPAAAEALQNAASLCGTTCSVANSLQLLQARQHLSQGRTAEALAVAELVLKKLPKDAKPNSETANSLRLVAEASLQLNNTERAISAAQAALQLDRELGQPARIAYDLLLLGAAQEGQAPLQAAAAYQRALQVANAAGLEKLSQRAQKALQSLSQNAALPKGNAP